MGSRFSPGILALDYGPSSLKFLEMRPEGLEVVAAGIVGFEAGDWRRPESLAAAVRVARERTGSAAAGVIASVPLCHAFVRVIDLPAETSDVAETLRWDMARYLARPLELYAVDYQPQPAGQAPGASRYLAAAYRLSEVEALREALRVAGVPALSALDVDALAVVNAFTANYPECLPERTLLIKADARATGLFRTQAGEYRGGTVRHEAWDPFSAAEPQDRAESLLRRARALSASLGEALGEWSAPERIFLCGDLAGDADFRELLKTAMSAPFALLNPFRKISGPNPADYPVAYPGAPFAAAVGLALRLAAPRTEER